jgi:hypothetical protein
MTHSLRYHSTGGSRTIQYRQSDHVAGQRRYVHGPLQPMEEPRGFLARLFGRR